MQDYKAARINMVDSQIHTMGVVCEGVLEAFRTIRREEFVPTDKRAVAYTDEDLAIGHGRILMEPVTQARLIQALSPASSDKTMDIGCGTGYSSAILASLCSKVFAVEPNANFLAESESNWARLGYGNIIPHNGPFAAGCPQSGSYDTILVNGTVAEIPQSLLDMLAPNGRMAIIVKTKTDKIGKAYLITKNQNGLVARRALFDAAVPYLPGHEPRNEFVF